MLYRYIFCKIMDDDVNHMEEQMEENIVGDEIFYHDHLVSAKFYDWMSTSALEYHKVEGSYLKKSPREHVGLLWAIGGQWIDVFSWQALHG